MVRGMFNTRAEQRKRDRDRETQRKKMEAEQEKARKKAGAKRDKDAKKLFKIVFNKKKPGLERYDALEKLQILYGEDLIMKFWEKCKGKKEGAETMNTYFKKYFDEIGEQIRNENGEAKYIEIFGIPDSDPNRAGGLVAPRTFSLRVDDGRVMYSNVFTRKCSERRTFMRGGTSLDLYVQPGASFRGHHWRTMLKTMYADKLPAKFDLYHARGKVDMAALVDGNMTVRGYK